MDVPAWFAGLTVGLFGLLFGSFANVVIWRFPRGESLSVPASHCPSCETPIRWHDNLPVVSWLVLRGTCRACGQPIPWRYPAVEILSAVLWVLAWIAFGVSVRLPFAIALFYLLLILSFIDLDTMRLPNTFVALLGLIGVIGVALSFAVGSPVLPLLAGADAEPGTALLAAAVGVLVGALPALGMSLLYAAVRGAQGLGMGDVKLLAAMGLFLGPYAGLVLFVGSVIGVVAAVVGRRVAGPESRVPFGPSLSLAGVVVALCGTDVVAWYLGLL